MADDDEKTGTPDRSQEKEVGQSKLAQLFAESQGIEPETASALAQAVIQAGFKAPEAVERITRDTFKKGREKAESELRKEIDDLKGMFAGLKTGGEREESPPTAKVDEGEDSTRPGPVPKGVAALAKQLQEQNKRFEELQAKFLERDESLKRERSALRQREIESKVKSTIGDLGYDEPETVLAILRSRASFQLGDFESDSPDGEIMVCKPGSTEPLKGDGTYTSLDDFLREWGESATGKRFRKVPAKAAVGTDMNGVASPANSLGKGGLNGLDDNALSRALRDKKFGPLR